MDGLTNASPPKRGDITACWYPTHLRLLERYKEHIDMNRHSFPSVAAGSGIVRSGVMPSLPLAP